jgi:hypothetical protein
MLQVIIDEYLERSGMDLRPAVESRKGAVAR